MAQSSEKRDTSPADRFRNIMSAEQDKHGATAGRRFPKRTAAPTLNLPKPGAPNQEQEPAKGGKPSAAEPGASTPRLGRIMPAFWTLASIISLLFNVVMLVFLISTLRMLGSLNAANLGSGVLGGLYSNFERMDQAHIKTEIPLQTTIPLNLTVPVQTTTAIQLAKDVSIPGAHVRINTALFNIDAPANVTLPAGTSLDVSMAFSLPVQAQVPVNLNVPVDIPLQNTDLHVAITGLQATVRPLYCMVDPGAESITGQPVCR